MKTAKQPSTHVRSRIYGEQGSQHLTVRSRIVEQGNNNKNEAAEHSHVHSRIDEEQGSQHLTVRSRIVEQGNNKATATATSAILK